MLRMTVTLGCLCLVPGAAGGWRGEVFKVYDGDVISARYGRGPANVRLFGVKAPDRAHPLANAARELTRKLVSKAKTVRVLPDGKARAGIVGWVFVGRVCINHELVKAGLAHWDRSEAPGDKKLAALEAEARKARRGLWSTSTSP